ncbi:MAG: DUF1192 domain-containing protein [Alphaproteobacteria bacterium]
MHEEDTPTKPTVHQVGENLDALSIEELEERIELLKSEIERLAVAIMAKRSSADVAASFFKT